MAVSHRGQQGHNRNVNDSGFAIQTQHGFDSNTDKSTQGATWSAVSCHEGDRRFTGFRLDEILVLEIFSGTGRLTRAIKDLGMQGMAVDKDSRRSQSVHVANYDLNEPDQLDAMCEFISKHQKQILWAHFAPSCGTASRARGKPLPKLEKMGLKAPKPLRSDHQPMGLDGLQGTDKIKAECANITYDSACVLMRLCIQLSIAVSLENPENSLFWQIPIVKQLLADYGGYMTYFDNCCHGGSRKRVQLGGPALIGSTLLQCVAMDRITTKNGMHKLLMAEFNSQLI